MADIRELILERLRETGEVRGVSSMFRNAASFSDGTALPAVVLYDGDEDAAETPAGRPAMQPRKVTMTPWFQITLMGDSEQIGTDLNTLRLRLIAAILGDATLLGYTCENQGIRYMGCMTKFVDARNTQADMAVRFAISYYLKTSDL